MFELTTLNVYTATDNGLLSYCSYCRRTGKKPDARFFCVRFGIVSRR